MNKCATRIKKNEWMNYWMNGLINELMINRVYEWMNEWIHDWSKEWKLEGCLVPKHFCKSIAKRFWCILGSLWEGLSVCPSITTFFKDTSQFLQVMCEWARAIFEVIRAFEQERWGQSPQKHKISKSDQPTNQLTDRPMDRQSGMWHVTKNYDQVGGKI